MLLLTLLLFLLLSLFLLLLLLLLLSLLTSSMLSLSVLLLVEQGCGGAWRSGKSPATLRTKEMVAVTKLMRLTIIHLYIFLYILCLFIYLFVFFIYLFFCLFNYLFIYSLFLLYYWNLDGSIRPNWSHLDSRLKFTPGCCKMANM